MQRALSSSNRTPQSWADHAVTHLNEQMIALDLERQGIAWASEAVFAAGFPLDAFANQIFERDASQLAASERPFRFAHDGRAYDVILAPDREAPRRYAFARIEDAAEASEAQTRHLADREQLLSTSREIAVGEIASTLAHELNQPLGSIVNLLRGVKMRAETGALAQQVLIEALDKAAAQALYASQVVARIRTFVAARAPKVSAIDLSQLAPQTLALLDWEIRRDNIDIETDLPNDLPKALGDPVMIQQVLVNLTRNAIEAMRAAAARPLLRISAAARDGGARIEIVISDRGPGVGPEAAIRLFSPLASGKPGGMGVGLSICRSIIELHRGRIWARDNAHGGADFHIVLPAAPRNAEP